MRRLSATRRSATRQVALADHVGVGGHGPADDRLAEPPARVDDDLVARAGQRVGAEDDRRDVGPDEVLDQHGQAHAVDGQPLLAAVLERALGAGRGPAALDRVGDRRRRRPRSGRSRAGRRTRRARRPRRPPTSARPRSARRRRPGRPGARTRSRARRAGAARPRPTGTRSRPRPLVGRGRQAEAGRNPVAGRQSREVGRLASDQQEVLAGRVAKPEYVHVDSIPPSPRRESAGCTSLRKAVRTGRVRRTRSCADFAAAPASTPPESSARVSTT